MRFFRKLRYIVKKQKKQLRRLKDKIVRFVADVLYDRDKSLLARSIGFVLLPFSFIFWGIVNLRIFLYRKKFLKSQALGCHVIVVGNITMGGTGKTPVAEYLAKELLARGRHPAIISRGYKSRSEPNYKKVLRWLMHLPPIPPKVVSDGKTIFFNSERAGDEPYMLAKNLPNVPVVVDKDRVKAGHYAIKRLGADILILDDGYQYFRLHSSLRLALVDKSNPFGNGFLLPRGILREPVSHLGRASCILLTKSDGARDEVLEKKIRQANPSADIIECTHRPCYLVEHATGAVLPLEKIKGKKVSIFSGIASPEGFEKFILSLGADIVYCKRYIDHHRFTANELSSIGERSRGADYIVTTEKDAVRINRGAIFPISLYFLRVEVKFLKNEVVIARMLDEILIGEENLAS